MHHNSIARPTVEGVKERMRFEQAVEYRPENIVENIHLPESSRRRKGKDPYNVAPHNFIESYGQDLHFFLRNTMNSHLELLSWFVVPDFPVYVNCRIFPLDFG